ncbi:hypothetical protein PLICRDRAFT_42759 [Plicaturopsis crispa FD-325 SS-3]|nr:hypothetical protein PLICRDRAFT_42759 [Plicaturopsis crispa FD-325 SS-3]
MSSSPTVYVVSGATRGIGLGLVTALVARPNVLVFAGARDPPSATALHALSAAHPGKLRVLKLVAGSTEDAKAAAETVKKEVGRVDVLIANAGIGNVFATAHEIKPEEVDKHFKVNTLGTLIFYQAFHALLLASPAAPKFVVISTVGGSIEVGAALPLGLAAYGTSKAALNFLTREIHFENERFVAFAVHPGTVDTDAAKLVGELVPAAAAIPHISVAESARTVLARVDEATREKNGGRFVTNDGDFVAW